MMKHSQAFGDSYCPTIIIGLGGCGWDAVALYRDIQRCETGRDDWPNHSFIGIDLGSCCDSFNDASIISLDCTFGEIQPKPAWLDSDLVSRMNSNETWMQRKAGRWAAWRSMSSIMEILQSKINEITDESALRRTKIELEGRFGCVSDPRWPYRIEEKSLHCIIVSSSSGGTGSGIIRDLGLSLGSAYPEATISLLLAIPGEDESGSLIQAVSNTESTISELSWWQVELDQVKFPDCIKKSRVPLFNDIHVIQSREGMQADPEALAVGLATLVHADSGLFSSGEDTSIFDSDKGESRVFHEMEITGTIFPLPAIANAASVNVISRYFQDWGNGSIRDLDKDCIVKDSIEYAITLYQEILQNIPDGVNDKIVGECCHSLQDGIAEFIDVDPKTVLMQIGACPVERPVRVMLDTVIPEHINKNADLLVGLCIKRISCEIVKLLLDPLYDRGASQKRNHLHYTLPAVRMWITSLCDAFQRKMENAISMKPDILRIDTVTPFSSHGLSLLSGRKKREKQAMAQIWDQYSSMVMKYLDSLNDQIQAHVILKVKEWLEGTMPKFLDRLQDWIDANSVADIVELYDTAICKKTYFSGSYLRDVAMLASRIRDGFTPSTSGSFCRWEIPEKVLTEFLKDCMSSDFDIEEHGASLLKTMHFSAKDFIIRYAFRGLVDTELLSRQMTAVTESDPIPHAQQTRHNVCFSLGGRRQENCIQYLPWWRGFSGTIDVSLFRTASEVLHKHRYWLSPDSLLMRLERYGVDEEFDRYVVNCNFPAEEIDWDGMHIRQLEKKVKSLNSKFNEPLLLKILCDIQDHPAETLNPGRRILERVTFDLFLLHDPGFDDSARSKSLDAILRDNQFTRKLDRVFVTTMMNLKELTNIGSHHQKNAKIDTKTAIIMLEQLCQIIEWYLVYSREGISSFERK